MLFVFSLTTKFSQKFGSAARKLLSEADSPSFKSSRDDHKMLGAAQALFTFTTKNPRYDALMFMVRRPEWHPACSGNSQK